MSVQSNNLARQLLTRLFREIADKVESGILDVAEFDRRAVDDAATLDGKWTVTKAHYSFVTRPSRSYIAKVTDVPEDEVVKWGMVGDGVQVP